MKIVPIAHAIQHHTALHTLGIALVVARLLHANSLITDAEDPTRDNPRKNALWGNLMAGGAGAEYYFGYAHDHSDLTCQDFRSRDAWWDYCRYALEFFQKHLPFWQMWSANDLTDDAAVADLEMPDSGPEAP